MIAQYNMKGKGKKIVFALPRSLASMSIRQE